MSPRSTGAEAIHDGHYREILARLQGLDGRMDEVRDTAQEGRDAALRLTAQLDALDLPAKVSALRTDMERDVSALRADMVHGLAGSRAEAKRGYDDLDARLKSIEAFRLKIEGASGALGWLAKHSPWIITVIMTALAALGFRGKLP